MKKQQIATSYSDYLKVDQLTGLQTTLTDAHDELQFIIVHQAFELWFKLSLYELESLRTAIAGDDMIQALHYLKRLQAIIKLLIDSFEVIETMRPYDFLQFRSRLQPASGLQSLQFREIEFICGLKNENYLKLTSGENRKRLERRAQEPSLWDAYLDLLSKHDLQTDTEEHTLASVIHIMKRPDTHPLGPLTESLTEFDQLFSLWRARHIRMTMRMIGAKPGTGATSVDKLGANHKMGAGGVDYLKTTLDKLFFPLLWEARTFMGS